MFTDADIHFEPDALSKAVGFCLARGLEHITVAPKFLDRPILLRGCLLNFAVSMAAALDPKEFAKPVGSIYAGIGAFNLIRSAELASAGGLDSIRMEVIDDGGVGLLMYEAGARSAILIGKGEVALDWYGSLGAMVRGLEKNAFSLVGYSLGAALLLVLPGLIAVVSMLIASSRHGRRKIRARTRLYVSG